MSENEERLREFSQSGSANGIVDLDDLLMQAAGNTTTRLMWTFRKPAKNARRIGKERGQWSGKIGLTELSVITYARKKNSLLASYDTMNGPTSTRGWWVHASKLLLSDTDMPVGE